MSRGQNTIKRSEVSTTPILLKYSASYDSASFSANGITVNRGINTSYNTGGVQFLNYALVRQLYYQEYVTGSLLFSSSYWNPSIQSTAAEGTFDNDYRYFPTSSSAELTVIGIPRTAFGEQMARKSLCITGSTYKLIDDGNGNVIDTYTAGSQASTNEAYAMSGVKLYYPGYESDGTGDGLVWNTANAGGSYAGTFFTNPVVANKTGRLNYAGLWSAKSLTYFGDFAISFNITAASNTTYYFGIGCDNYGSLYLDDALILKQITPDATVFGGNYKYWHIYPVDITAGTHTVKFVGTNAGIPDPGNPGSMGIEVYNNTQTQISSSITAEPLGSTIPVGLNVIYSSKDHLTDTVYSENTHVGNVLYSQGVIVITNEEYSNAMIPSTIPTTTTTSTTSTTTTGVPTTTTTSTTSTTTTGIPTTTTTSTTTSTTTIIVPTTTSTTTSTTTDVPTTTTTSTTTTTTTVLDCTLSGGSVTFAGEVGPPIE